MHRFTFPRIQCVVSVFKARDCDISSLCSKIHIFKKMELIFIHVSYVNAFNKILFHFYFLHGHCVRQPWLVRVHYIQNNHTDMERTGQEILKYTATTVVAPPCCPLRASAPCLITLAALGGNAASSRLSPFTQHCRAGLEKPARLAVTLRLPSRRSRPPITGAKPAGDRQYGSALANLCFCSVLGQIPHEAVVSLHILCCLIDSSLFAFLGYVWCFPSIKWGYF